MYIHALFLLLPARVDTYVCTPVKSASAEKSSNTFHSSISRIYTRRERRAAVPARRDTVLLCAQDSEKRRERERKKQREKNIVKYTSARCV